jgi:hypothetical protein
MGCLAGGWAIGCLWPGADIDGAEDKGALSGEEEQPNLSNASGRRQVRMAQPEQRMGS